MTLPELNLLVLKVRDVEACGAFYASLGLQLVRERHGRGPEHFSAKAGGRVLLELYPTSANSTAEHVRLGFVVDALDPAVSAAVQAGGTLITQPRRGDVERRAVISDPEGHRVELVEALAGIELPAVGATAARA